MKNENMKKKIENDLLNYDIILERNGGETPVVEISALKGKNIDEFYEALVKLV